MNQLTFCIVKRFNLQLINNQGLVNCQFNRVWCNRPLVCSVVLAVRGCCRIDIYVPVFCNSYLFVDNVGMQYGVDGLVHLLNCLNHIFIIFGLKYFSVKPTAQVNQ